jgi:hypothetical protein
MRVAPKVSLRVVIGFGTNDEFFFGVANMNNPKVADERTGNSRECRQGPRKIKTFAKRVFLIIPSRNNEQTNHASQRAKT